MTATVEFISRFARPLPQRVMASLLGFPLEDIPQLARWGDAVVTPFVHGTGLKHELTPEQTTDMLARLDGFQDYIYEHVRAKRLDPHDDMVSFLCGVHYEALDRKLTDLEIAGIVHAMIIGGLETTQYALEEQAQLLCEHTGALRAVASRSSKAAFVHRGGAADALADPRAVDPCDLAGRGLPGRRGAGGLAPAPAVWRGQRRRGGVRLPVRSRPRPGRGHPPRGVLHGPTGLSGANLSRIEQQIAWGVLLDRIESIEYGDGNDWLHQPGIMLGTLS